MNFLWEYRPARDLITTYVSYLQKNSVAGRSTVTHRNALSGDGRQSHFSSLGASPSLVMDCYQASEKHKQSP